MLRLLCSTRNKPAYKRSKYQFISSFNKNNSRTRQAGGCPLSITNQLLQISLAQHQVTPKSIMAQIVAQLQTQQNHS